AQQLPASEASPLVVATHLYALLLAGAVFWYGAALGRALLRPLGLAGESELEDWLFALGLGLGATAYLVLALGLLGLLTPWAIAVTLAGVGVLVRRQLFETVVAAWSGWSALLAKRAAVRKGHRLLAFSVPLLELM